ncbi:hypothetical protein ACJRO7_024902 [Eucalyptus globulus]|uniref:PdxS/SNZ N-terminal domain-containing protein n=1 Tax=Eucalyptus globulus TaxID=34317 RepID=A0ABD3KCH0_EUCGL
MPPPQQEARSNLLELTPHRHSYSLSPSLLLLLLLVPLLLLLVYILPSSSRFLRPKFSIALFSRKKRSFPSRHSGRASGQMAEEGVVTVYNSNVVADTKKNPFSLKVGMAQMLRGGAIFEATSVEQAKIAEEAGACSVVVSHPSGAATGISRMPDPSLIKDVKRAVSIPIVARARVGHFVEAQILEAVGVDYIDESEAIAIADEDNYINKHNFRSPFVCGCRSLGEALRRVREGAAMIRIQGDLDRSGDVVETVKNVRSVMGEMRVLNNMDDDEVFAFAKKIEAPYDLVAQSKQMGRLPVVHFAAGGIVTPADAALMMQLGCDGVFVGSEVFDCSDPYKRVQGIVRGVRHYTDPHVLVETCSGLAGLHLGQERIEESEGQ